MLESNVKVTSSNSCHLNWWGKVSQRTWNSPFLLVQQALQSFCFAPAPTLELETHIHCTKLSCALQRAKFSSSCLHREHFAFWDISQPGSILQNIAFTIASKTRMLSFLHHSTWKKQNCLCYPIPRGVHSLEESSPLSSWVTAFISTVTQCLCTCWEMSISFCPSRCITAGTLSPTALWNVSFTYHISIEVNRASLIYPLLWVLIVLGFQYKDRI